jgi:hypothetical protein
MRIVFEEHEELLVERIRHGQHYQRAEIVIVRLAAQWSAFLHVGEASDSGRVVGTFRGCWMRQPTSGKAHLEASYRRGEVICRRVACSLNGYP